MKIATYIRVSTDMQSTDSQAVAIQNYCSIKGYDLDNILPFKDEGISGSTLDRPGFKAMMSAVKTGTISKIITFELSRLSRDFKDGFLLMQELADANVEVETPGEGIIKMDTVMEQFVVIAKSLVAQQERQKIRERTKAGLVAAKARGVVLGAPKGNSNRLGYRKTYSPELASQIALLRKKGLSYKDIGKVLGTNHMNVFNICKREIFAKAL